MCTIDKTRHPVGRLLGLSIAGKWQRGHERLFGK